MSAGRYSVLLLLVSLVACDREADQPAPAGPRPEPIVVYASNDDVAYLPGLFAEFTRQTGTRVTLRHAEAVKNVADVLNKRGSPPADLLITPTAIGVWKVAEEGFLRPLSSNYIRQHVVPGLRDTDHYWTAISYRLAQIFYDRQRLASAAPASYEDLAEPEYKGLLCLSSSALAVNRSIIAMLIQSQGRRPAEIIVRGWVSNLALPPFASEAELVKAIDAGTCAVGFVSASEQQLASLPDRETRFLTLSPTAAALSVEAAGINRHAREPEAALVLLEWLLSTDVQADHSRATRSQKALAEHADDPSLAAYNAAAVAAFDADAVSLAERARYR